MVKVRKRMDCTTAFRRAIAPVDGIILRCNHFTNHVKWSAGAPEGIAIAPANEFHQFKNLNHSAASMFLKNLSFQNFRFMDQEAWIRITFLFRNARPWYLQETFLRHGPTKRFSKVFTIHDLRSRKFRSKFENILIVRPPFVEQLPLQTILVYGVTTLRIMWNEAWARRKALKSRQRANFMNLEAWTPQQRQFSRNFGHSKISGSWTTRLGFV